MSNRMSGLPEATEFIGIDAATMREIKET